MRTSKPEKTEPPVVVSDWAKPRSCVHGMWASGRSYQDCARLKIGPYDTYGPPRHREAWASPVIDCLAMPENDTLADRCRLPDPAPSAVRVVLSTLPELLLAWALEWLKHHLPDPRGE